MQHLRDVLCKVRRFAIILEVAHHRLRELIVHHAVELIAAQPLRWWVPDLADDDRVRIYSLYPLPPLAPENAADFVRHVEPPTIHTIGGIAIAVRVHPPPRDRFDMLAQPAVNVPVLTLLQHRQPVEAPPAFPFKRRPTCDRVPVFEPRVLAVAL